MNLYRKLKQLAWKLSMKGIPRGHHITRYFMYKRLQLVGNQLPIKSGRVLTISRSVNLVDILGLKPIEVVEANYPDHNILSLGFKDNSFDFILTDQVLEHVEGAPQQAIDECNRVLKPGGIAVHTTCFINPVHEFPKDFWRFTPEALLQLHKNWSEIVECGGWGNFDMWEIVQEGLRFEGIPLAAWHPLHKLAIRNDPEWPVVTWIVARK